MAMSLSLIKKTQGPQGSTACGPLAQLSTYDAGHFTMLKNNAIQKRAIKEAIAFYDAHLTL